MFPEVIVVSEKMKHPSVQKQPLPDREIEYHRRHEKTADDLPETGELPVITLEKSIPETELHDM